MTPEIQGSLFIEGAIKTIVLSLLTLIGVIGLAGALFLLVSQGWLVNQGSFEGRPIPTLIPTASLNLLVSRQAAAPAIAQNAPAATRPDTPVPMPTLTPLPTATATEKAAPKATAIPTDTPTPTWTVLPSPLPPLLSPLPTSTDALAQTPTAVPMTVEPTAPPPLPPTATPVPPTTQPTTSGTMPDLDLIPGQPQGYLNRFRLVSYYGSPLGSGLGKLGDYSRDHTLRLLRAEVAQYQALSSDRLVFPAYHMVTTVANSYPPDYRHHLGLEVIDEWVASAKANGVAVVLDIQPGRANVIDEFDRIRYLLYEPHVHLAIDPEFLMNEGQVPGVNLGQMTAAQVNEIQVRMNGIGYEIGLNRILILHQFADRMLPDKELIQSYPFVELVIDGDGFGSPYVKISNYNQYAGEPGFEYGGFKLFPTDGDNPLMSPEYVMSALFPPPVIIIYQ